MPPAFQQDGWSTKLPICHLAINDGEGGPDGHKECEAQEEIAATSAKPNWIFIFTTLTGIGRTTEQKTSSRFASGAITPSTMPESQTSRSCRSSRIGTSRISRPSRHRASSTRTFVIRHQEQRPARTGSARRKLSESVWVSIRWTANPGRRNKSASGVFLPKMRSNPDCPKRSPWGDTTHARLRGRLHPGVRVAFDGQDARRKSHRGLDGRVWTCTTGTPNLFALC